MQLPKRPNAEVLLQAKVTLVVVAVTLARLHFHQLCAIQDALRRDGLQPATRLNARHMWL